MINIKQLSDKELEEKSDALVNKLGRIEGDHYWYRYAQEKVKQEVDRYSNPQRDRIIKEIVYTLDLEDLNGTLEENLIKNKQYGFCDIFYNR